MLTHEEAKKHIRYDPETGLLWWRLPRHKRTMLRPAGGINSKGYLVIGIDGKRYYAHRVAWLLMTGDWPESDIDHKNGSTSDNRWQNLREATRGLNLANAKAYKCRTSELKGVSWHKSSGKWQAKICVGYKQKHLGLFTTEEEAHKAYRRAAQEAFGEYARFE